jgi:Fe-S-cluster containining protein
MYFFPSSKKQLNQSEELRNLKLKAESKEDVYKTLKKKIKESKFYDVNTMMYSAHDEAFQQTDCLNCANCCKSIPPMLENEDVRRIAKHMKMPVTDFRKKFMTRDSDGDPVFQKTPCHFLGKDNKCSIYDIRPKACAEYPFTNYPNTKSVFGMIVNNAGLCPAVSRVLDTMEKNLENS